MFNKFRKPVKPISPTPSYEDRLLRARSELISEIADDEKENNNFLKSQIKTLRFVFWFITAMLLCFQAMFIAAAIINASWFLLLYSIITIGAFIYFSRDYKKQILKYKANSYPYTNSINKKKERLDLIDYALLNLKDGKIKAKIEELELNDLRKQNQVHF